MPIELDSYGNSLRSLTDPQGGPSVAERLDGYRHPMHQTKRQELVGCHDCGRGVSFSALSCPHCGSTQPSGPYILSARELKQHRIEEKNDKRLVLVTVLCCAIGVAFGVLTASGPLSAVLGGVGYGFVGVMIGMPAAFIINVTRLFG